tara:strand:+ start:409 stop:654 length:246 start_codon:yes stop_codon:yes gene_type:complete
MKFQEFPIPTELNGEQLKAELNCDEVYIRDQVLVIGGDVTEAQAKAAIAAHKAVQPSEPTIDEKLASVGLSINDLKAALGL